MKENKRKVHKNCSKKLRTGKYRRATRARREAKKKEDRK